MEASAFIYIYVCIRYRTRVFESARKPSDSVDLIATKYLDSAIFLAGSHFEFYLFVLTYAADALDSSRNESGNTFSVA